jgi:hypothetical protein
MKVRPGLLVSHASLVMKEARNQKWIALLIFMWSQIGLKMPLELFRVT